MLKEQEYLLLSFETNYKNLLFVGTKKDKCFIFFLTLLGLDYPKTQNTFHSINSLPTHASLGNFPKACKVFLTFILVNKTYC